MIRLRDKLTTLCELLGMLFVAAAGFAVDRALGLLALGLGLLAVGIFEGRK